MLIRQTIFGLAIFLLFSVAMSGDASAQPRGSDDAQPTFVIVHGAWGGSWAFREVDSLLSERGYTVYRPSLTGLGERVHLATPDVGLSTHIEDVVNVLRFEELHDVILVGHSYGGMIITGVADRVPDRIRRLVYVDAFVPEDGESVADVRGNGAAGMEEEGFIVPPWVEPDQPPPKDVPQPTKTFTEPLNLEKEAVRELPATYILTVEAGHDAEDDDFASQAERAKERGWAVDTLEADHNPQWSAPELLVEMLDQSR